ncbi:methyltransferase family protein [Tropicibacter oceani]|uniref:Isoprenylcysteine carboxylmethyltransferase family protein n=1 Tax=Tropicibacter oceani TaxID=3058420 RepID=A0ABY8QEM2_9RHOB|nr:isoprenylcysteine carboxylmethyltransferase family protein [Tropicibacter oceani]WGW02448.1 isoprenylcysteine carboxylmethyltransferase family protein [Tropicibacter oceani]
MLKWLDIPPVWLLGCLALAWAQKTYVPMGLDFGTGLADLLGGLMVGAGIVVMLLAVHEMRRHQTTIIPHMQAARLVTTGIFKRSRNPIYLGDSLILTGMILYWDAVLGLPLIPLFVWIIEKRFVEPEELRLKRKFLAEFSRYTQQTRRWL